MNKEMLESYMKAIEEELEMMRGKSITLQVLKYLDELMYTYHKLSKCVNKYSEDEYVEYETNDDKDYEDLDEDKMLHKMLEHYKKYCHYKKEYQDYNKQNSLDMAKEELVEFFNIINMMFENIEENSRDDMEERDTIKSHVKQIYQMFN